MNYVAHQANGKIIQVGICPEDALQFQCGIETKKLLTPTLIDPATFYVVNGELAPLPTKPGENYEFDYEAKAWVYNAVEAWGVLRYKRDQLIAATDWRVTKAMESGSSLSAPWVAYRQALRDVTNQSDPLNIVWPVEPT